ncbi:hypothetical protein H632_c489p0, partial [Helicosporidium sp. ATCC 50920]
RPYHSFHYMGPAVSLLIADMRTLRTKNRCLSRVEERQEFIDQLHATAVIKRVRISIISGDVHVAGVGRLYSYPKIRPLRYEAVHEAGCEMRGPICSASRSLSFHKSAFPSRDPMNGEAGFPPLTPEQTETLADASCRTRDRGIKAPALYWDQFDSANAHPLEVPPEADPLLPKMDALTVAAVSANTPVPAPSALVSELAPPLAPPVQCFAPRAFAGRAMCMET